MIASLVSLTALGVLSLAAFGLGRPVVRALGPAGADWESYLWSMGVGWVVLGSGIAALGAAQLLYGSLIVALALLAMTWGWIELFGDIALARRAPAEPPEEPIAVARPSAWMFPLVVAAMAPLAGGSLISALAPPTAGDALCYHLEVPKVFLAEHRLVALPDCAETTYPLLAEMAYLAALALDGPVAAQLVHWEMGLLLAAAAGMLARPLVGDRFAALVALVTLAVPAVTNQMTSPLNDAAVAFFCTLALAGGRLAAASPEPTRAGALAGIVAGGALATKYLALVLAAAAAVVAAYYFWRRRDARPAMGRAALALSVVAVSFAGPWYARAAWHRGNPVYPFFDAAWGGDAPEKLAEGKRPLGANPLELAAAPWIVTFQPERFGGRGHQIGAWFLAMLPALAVARRLRGAAPLGAVAVVYAALWYLLRQNTRFLLPILPVAALFSVWAWIEVRRFPLLPRRVALACAALLVAVGVAWPSYRARRHWDVALGRVSRNDYLYDCEPTFLAATVANALRAPGDRLLSQDYRGFYFDAPVVRESVYRRRTSYHQRIDPARPIARQLCERGFSHVLLAEATGPGIHFDDTLARLFDKYSASDCLVDYRFVDADGAERRYRLLKLR